VLTPAGIAAVIEHHFNHRDLHALEALWDEDIHFEGPGVAFTGREGMAAQERNLWRAFPDVASEARTFVAGEDRASLTIRFQGTHDGPLRLNRGTTLPATGRPIDFTFAALIVLRDGLMAEESVFYDTAGFFRQLGATTG
jgi:predicted ester cyclase